jgi:hypothetical protein
VRRAAGLRHLVTHHTLRGLYINALVFGGAIRKSSPLIAVLMLDDLHLSALEYGIALGAPCAAGLLGSFVAQRITRRLGTDRVLLVFGALRGPCLLPLAFAPVGILGLLTVVSADSVLLFIVLGGWLATLLGVRVALLIATILCALSGLFLPALPRRVVRAGCARRR